MITADLAHRTGGEAAVESASGRLTVAELRTAVGAAVARLGRPSGPVTVDCADPVDQLVWALAADRAGVGAAVLDPRWPVVQRAAAVAVVGPAVVVGPSGPQPGPGGGVAGRGWIAFTSGSTGTPSAVWRSPASWTASHPALDTLVGFRRGDRVLVPGALASSLCAFAALHAVARGGCAVLLERWTPDRVPPVDVAHLVPTMLTDLLAVDAPPPRVAIVGGAALDPALEAAVARSWPATRLVTYYGSTEQSFVTARVGGGSSMPGTAGRAFPGVRLEIRDEDGAPVPTGTSGVVWTHSPYAAVPLADAPGPAREWVSVGDRGVLDGNGVLTVLGRERVVTGGATVEPAAVEAVLRQADGVREAVVFGLPHPRLGEVVAAAIEGGSLASLRGLARAHLAPAQRPRRWFAAGPMPRTPLGKPARAAVIGAARDGRLPPLS